MSLFAPLEGLIAPAPPESRIAFLKMQPFAHRGLHGDGLIENSRAAFHAAIALGHGIETDVQATRNGDALVFHDYTLERLTSGQGDLAARSTSELTGILLKGTSEPIPRLTEMLALVGSRVPLLIEIKVKGRQAAPLCRSVCDALDAYAGAVAIMSFNPFAGSWFRKHAPHIVRGLVVSEENKRNLQGAIERWTAMAKAKPDFLAYDIRDLPSGFAGRAKARGIPVLTWTVRRAEDRRRASLYADGPIYELQP